MAGTRMTATKRAAMRAEAERKALEEAAKAKKLTFWEQIKKALGL